MDVDEEVEAVFEAVCVQVDVEKAVILCIFGEGCFHGGGEIGGVSEGEANKERNNRMKREWCADVNGWYCIEKERYTFPYRRQDGGGWRTNGWR